MLNNARSPLTVW